jgi:hypothetical protein
MKIEIDQESFEKFFSLVLRVMDREEKRWEVKQVREEEAHKLNMDLKRVELQKEQLEADSIKLDNDRKKAKLERDIKYESGAKL